MYSPYIHYKSTVKYATIMKYHRYTIIIIPFHTSPHYTSLYNTIMKYHRYATSMVMINP